MSALGINSKVPPKANTTVTRIEAPKEETVPSIGNSLPDPFEKEVSAASPMECAKEEADRKWEEAFAKTTPEQWTRLEQMFRKDEEEGLMPLVFPEL